MATHAKAALRREDIHILDLQGLSQRPRNPRLPQSGYHRDCAAIGHARCRSPAAPMSIRRSTVEHPFGTIKSRTGPRHFLTRRLQGLRLEIALNVRAWNIKRMVALVGIKGRMAAIQGWNRPAWASIEGSACFKATFRAPEARPKPGCGRSEPKSTRRTNRDPHPRRHRGFRQPPPLATTPTRSALCGRSLLMDPDRGISRMPSFKIGTRSLKGAQWLGWKTCLQNAQPGYPCPRPLGSGREVSRVFWCVLGGLSLRQEPFRLSQGPDIGRAPQV